MDNKTVINAELQQDTKCMPLSMSSSSLLKTGTVLCDKYVVAQRLMVASREADLYLCNYQGVSYVAKLYQQKTVVEQDIVNQLLRVDCPFIAKLYEVTTYNEMPLEILHYYKNGNLQQKKLTFNDLKRIVIPNINEALHTLHKIGMVHKNLKPTNIMLTDDMQSIVLIDFGIRSVLEDTSSGAVAKPGITSKYSAPETFQNLFLEESDYYSFGITLFELFTGYTPYDNMSNEEISQCFCSSPIPFPSDMPTPLADFISALTYCDITNQQDKENPNRRWTYEEVEKWLAGETVILPEKNIGNAENRKTPPYLFLEQPITDSIALAEAFAQNWEEGKKHLFRGFVTVHFRDYDSKIATLCAAAEEARKTNGKEDLIFFKLLYELHPALQGFYWKENSFENLPALGQDILEHLWERDGSQNKYYESILSENLLSQYTLAVTPENETLRKSIAALEESYQLKKADSDDLVKLLYWVAYTLSDQRLLTVDHFQFATINEFVTYVKDQLEISFENFQQLCYSLVDYDGTLDVQFEAWLIAIGKEKELETWRNLMKE